MSEVPFSTTCSNIERFVALHHSGPTRSSLSPERELRQMTFRGFTIKEEKDRSDTSPTTVEEEAEEVTKVLPLYRKDEEQIRFAQTWQYGSPVYHPVTDRFYCCCGADLHLKVPSTYTVEGVSCDLCGFTHWNTSEKDTVANIFFFHCDRCGADFCPFCIHDVFLSERFHAPCSQCSQCDAYVFLQDSSAHRCSATREENKELQGKTAIYLELLMNAFKEIKEEKTVAPEVAKAPRRTSPPKRKSTSRSRRSSVSTQATKRVKKETEASPSSVSPKRTPVPTRKKKATPNRTSSSPHGTLPWEVVVPYFNEEEKKDGQQTFQSLGVPATLRERSGETELSTIVASFPTRIAAEKCACAVQDLGHNAVVKHS